MVRDVRRQKLDGAVGVELAECVDDDPPGGDALPGPGDGVQQVVVADGDGLHGHAGQEPAHPEGDQPLPVGAGPLGEDEDLLPARGAQGALRPVADVLDGVLPAVGVRPQDQDRLRHLDDCSPEWDGGSLGLGHHARGPHQHHGQGVEECRVRRDHEYGRLPGPRLLALHPHDEADADVHEADDEADQLPNEQPPAGEWRLVDIPGLEAGEADHGEAASQGDADEGHQEAEGKQDNSKHT